MTDPTRDAEQAVREAKRNALAIVGHRFTTPNAAEEILDALIASVRQAERAAVLRELKGGANGVG